jgi:hypothetical protein
MTETMRAIRLTRPGGVGALVPTKVPKPDVRAAGSDAARAPSWSR